MAAAERFGLPVELIPCDPAHADTVAFCAQYGYPAERAANTIIVASKKEPKQYAACVVLATTRLDVNHAVRDLLGAAKCSFASAEEMRAVTGMTVGGVTAFGLPQGLPVFVDARVLDLDWVILGTAAGTARSGSRPRCFAGCRGPGSWRGSPCPSRSPSADPLAGGSEGSAVSDSELGFLGIAEPRPAARRALALARRALPGAAPALRAARADPERLRHARARADPRRGAPRGAGAPGRPRAGAPSRRADRRQRSLLDPGRAHDRRLQGAGRLRARRGRERRGPAPGRRRDRVREDKHARVRLWSAQRVSLRAVPEPVGPGPLHGRL